MSDIALKVFWLAEEHKKAALKNGAAVW